MSETISTQVMSAVALVLNKDSSLIQAESTFIDLGADDLDAIQIIMKVEEIFSLEISDNDAEQLTSVVALTHYVERRLA